MLIQYRFEFPRLCQEILTPCHSRAPTGGPLAPQKKPYRVLIATRNSSPSQGEFYQQTIALSVTSDLCDIHSLILISFCQTNKDLTLDLVFNKLPLLQQKPS